MEYKNGPKIDKVLSNVEQHSQRMTRDADDGPKSGARRTVLQSTTDATTLKGGGSEAMGRDKGYGT